MTGLGEDRPRRAGEIWRGALPVWAALMALLVATVAGAYQPLGRLAIPVALAIAAAKAALVLRYFMQLRRPDPLVRLAASAALVFVAFLFTLTFADVLTRAPPTQPGQVTPRGTMEGPASGRRAF